MKTNTKHLLKREEGFTLVEVIAVLIILGILAAVAVPKYIGLEENAKNRAIDAGISELNGRESLNWAKAKIETDVTKVYSTDAKFVTDFMSGGAYTLATDMYNLNTADITASNPGNYVWTTAPSLTQGTLTFQGGPAGGVLICRTASSLDRPALWARSKNGTSCP